MKFIGLGELSIQLLYPFLLPVFSMVRIFLFWWYKRFYSDYLFISLIEFLSEILCGVLYLISKYQIKNAINPLQSLENISLFPNEVNKVEEIKEGQNATNHFSFIDQKENDITNNAKIYLLMCLLSFLDFLTFNVLSFICSYNEKFPNNLHSEARNIKILITIIIGLGFFHFKIYKHQIISILLILAGFFFNLSMTFCLNDLGVKQLYLLLGFLICYILITVQQFEEKWLMDKHKVSPYKLLFFEGLFGAAINIISFIPTYFIGCFNGFNICYVDSKDKNFMRLYNIFSTFQKMKEGDFWAFLSFTFLSSFAYNVLSRLTLLYFSTTHQNVSDCLSSFIFWIIVISVKPDSYEPNKETDIFLNSFIPLPGYLIIIFGTLLYNEIIIFYCGGLEYNTKKEISRRARAEPSYLIEKGTEYEIALQ